MTPARGWRVDDYAKLVVALADRLGIERFSVVGHSFGVRIAIALASAERSRVDSMVLTGAAGPRAVLLRQGRAREGGKAIGWLGPPGPVGAGAHPPPLSDDFRPTARAPPTSCLCTGCAMEHGLLAWGELPMERAGERF